MLNSNKSTISYNLLKLGISRKKNTLYAERNEEKRNTFWQELEWVNPADLVYVDECGLDESISHPPQRHIGNMPAAPIGQQVKEVEGSLFIIITSFNAQ